MSIGENMQIRRFAGCKNSRRPAGLSTVKIAAGPPGPKNKSLAAPGMGVGVRYGCWYPAQVFTPGGAVALGQKATSAGA